MQQIKIREASRHVHLVRAAKAAGEEPIYTGEPIDIGRNLHVHRCSVGSETLETDAAPSHEGPHCHDLRVTPDFTLTVGEDVPVLDQPRAQQAKSADGQPAMTYSTLLQAMVPSSQVAHFRALEATRVRERPAR
jgi:hypothetical protein